VAAAACAGSIGADDAPGPGHAPGQPNASGSNRPGGAGGAGAPGAGGATAPSSRGGGGDPAATPGSSAPEGPVTLDGTCPPKGAALGPRLRRLGPQEYRALVTALLHGRGRTGPLPAGFRIPFADNASANDRYTSFASTTTIGDAHLADVLDVSELVATAFVDKLDAAPGSCLRSGAFADCARNTLRGVAEILFRRPIDAESEQVFGKLALDAAADRGPKGALASAVKAMLASPDTLFHVELGRARTAAGGPALDAFEIAQVIASVLGGGPPDEALWQAAHAGRLATAEQIRPHVVRLLGDFTRSPQPLMRFVRELFGYEKVTDVFKDEKFHNPEGLIGDTDALVSDVIAKHGRSGFFAALLSTRTGFVSAATAPSYGLDTRMVASKVPLRMETLAQRMGLMTQPSFLAANSENTETAPVKRGIFVRSELLCQPVPALPIGLVPVLPDVPMTAREKLAVHNAKPDCAACHRMMDGFGLAFEIFDHLGRHRTLDHGKPIDAAGILDGSGNQDGPFKDALELTQRLSQSEAVAACMARQMFRFVSARPERDVDGCAIAQMSNAYARSNGDLIELIVAALSAESFRTRLGK
jgi:hypothetical protein